MLLLIALIFGLLPGFAWLVFYLSEDPYPEPKRLIVFTFVIGIAFGFFTIGVEQMFNGFMAGVNIAEFSIISLFGLALIEEIMKFAAAHFAINRNPAFDEPIDAMIYLVVAALGFATLENIGAISNIPWQTAYIPEVFATISLRFVGATLLHSLTSGIIGYHWAVGILRRQVARHLIQGFAIAAILHTFFNYLILNYGNAAYSVLFLVVVGFFVLNDFEELKGKFINIIN